MLKSTVARRRREKKHNGYKKGYPEVGYYV
jgi:hypothetical protein